MTTESERGYLPPGYGPKAKGADLRVLVKAWPWPQEAATTRDGFGQVAEAVESVVRARMAEAWAEGYEAGLRPGKHPRPNPYTAGPTP